MWFRRDLRLADNPALLEAVRGRRRCSRSSCSTRRSGARPGRRAAPTSPRRSARSTASSGSAEPRLSRAPRRPGAPGACSPPRRSAPSGCTSPPTSAPTATARDRDVEQALADAGIELVRTGSPYAVAPGRVDQRLRRPLQGLHAVLARPGPTTAGAARSTRPTGASWLELDDGHRPTSPTRRCPPGSSCPRPARPRRRGAGGRSSTGSTTTTTTATGPASTAPRACRCTSSGARSTRARCSPTWPAAQRGAATYRTELAWREFYADVLFHRAARPRASTSGRSSRGWRYDEPGRPARRLAAGPHRLPDRGRRDAPAAGHRLDAQPGPDDRRQLPGQGPARRVAARRPALHALAGRRRPRLQPARLAVDGGLRHRRGAVLPGLQPDHARASKFDPDGAYVRRWVAGARDRPVPTRTTRPGHPRAGRLPGADRRPRRERQEALDRWEAIRDRGD